MIEKINPTIPIPITSSPIPDEQRESIMAKSSIAIPNPIFFIVNPPLQIPIYWAKPSIPHSTMKEHPDIVKFCHFSAYVRTRSAGILRGLTPWHTDFGTKSSVLHLVRGVQAPGTHVRSDYSQTRHIGGRPSSHKANLIPQSKRQDTTIIVIPCLCSFTVPSSPSAKLPINKKRTRTLFRKESGSSTNCMVGHPGLEPGTKRL